MCMHIFKNAYCFLLLMFFMQIKTSENITNSVGNKLAVARRYRHEVYATTKADQKVFMLTEEDRKKRNQQIAELKKAQELKQVQVLIDREQNKRVVIIDEERDELEKIKSNFVEIPKSEQIAIKARKSQQGFDSFSHIVRTFYTDSSEQGFVKQENLFSLLPCIMPDMFNRIDPQTGQAVVHALTPLYWSFDLLEAMHLHGVDFSIQTQSPDRFPGSTIGHNVAGMIVNKRFKLSQISDDTNKRRILRDQINRSHVFFVWLIKRYPDVLKIESRRGLKYLKIFDILFNHDRDVILERLGRQDRVVTSQTAAKQ